MSFPAIVYVILSLLIATAATAASKPVARDPDAAADTTGHDDSKHQA